MRAMIIAAIVLASSPALASPSCMTQNEARQKFPAAHLWWHGPNRCWDATPSRAYLAQRIKTKEARPAQFDARTERNAPEEKKPEERKRPDWAHEPRWREAMSRMLPDDMAAVEAPAPARATASVDPVATAPPRINWRDRWVEIAQRVPPVVDKAGPADLTADTEPIVTPVRVMLVLLTLVLTLGVFELLRRPSRRAD
jgi:hypothetical protein